MHRLLTARFLVLWLCLFSVGGWFAFKFWLSVNHGRVGSHSAPQTNIYEAYAGSASCRECHAEAFKKWAGSHHAEAERLIQTNRDQAAFAPAHFNRGVLLFHNGEHEEALDAFKAHVRLAPNDERGWFNRGLAAMKLDNYQEAVDSFKQALRLRPDYMPAQKALAKHSRKARVWGWPK